MLSRRRFLIGTAGLGTVLVPFSRSLAEKTWTPAVKPKAIGPTVNKGLSWLVGHQLENGGWGQGEESQQMGRNEKMASTSNVADTCIASLALVRAGSTAKSGGHHQKIARAVGYVLSQIEASDDSSLFVTDVRGTRVQAKIGTYIDTFLSAQLLAELKGQMPTAAANQRLTKGLNKVLAKIEKNQRADGTWDDRGWAPVLSQAVAAKGLTRAKQRGLRVDEEVLERTEANAAQAYAGGDFSGKGSAGVGLYSAAASTGALADSVTTNEMDEDFVKELAANAKDPRVRKQAKDKLARYDAAKRQRDGAQGALVKKLEDPRFASGFGSNGGEEFLSYMLVSESLVVKGGDEWKRWDALMAKNLSRVQNKDGSWTGHHCITGRTFCTSAALLVLLADRAPVPLAGKVRG